jgi:hypothetical protein
MAEIKKRSAGAKVSVAEMVNRILRSSLRRQSEDESRRQRFREKPVAMGDCRADLTKALQHVAAIEDDEVERELSLRK